MDLWSFRSLMRTSTSIVTFPFPFAPQLLPPDIKRRMVVLTSPGAPGDPEMWEMEEVDPATVTVPGDGVIQLTGPDGVLRTYRRTAATYEDGAAFVIGRDHWEEWSFLNLGGPPHPMHVHLVRFQVLRRSIYDVSGFSWQVRGTTEPVSFLQDAPIDPAAEGAALQG